MDAKEESFARAYAAACLTLATTFEGPMSQGGAKAAMVGLSVIALVESDPGNRSEAVILRDAEDMASRPAVRAEVDRLLGDGLRIPWPAATPSHGTAPA